MIKFTLIKDYIFDEPANIWLKSNYEDIKYSDGAEVEQRLFKIVSNATDLSVLSQELRQHCTDWPTLYHLSTSRANLLRPFEAQLVGADVLEIGAGCGAITRFLGECGASVLALEGTKIRASIARARTKDLQNVEVVVDSFKDFNLDKKFDFITLIGVLEYANLFMDGGCPAQNLLDHASKFLKPDGKIIIAIENQLGLKYFAGAPEDHLGIPMYGIEGRYLKSQVQTFGRFELEKMLRDVGMRKVKFFSPLPDYKLPCSIVSEEGFEREDFDSAALAWQSVHRDPQLPEKATFCLELAWPTIVKNRLGLDLANSFLIVASNDRNDTDQNKGILAWHYSTSRRSEYCKETKFLSTPSGIQVACKLLKPGEKGERGEFISHKIKTICSYVSGAPLDLYFIRLIAQEGLTTGTLVECMRRYLHALGRILSDLSNRQLETDISSLIPGEYFECTPKNIVFFGDYFEFIGGEWFAEFPLELGNLVVRALLPIMNERFSYGSGWKDMGQNDKDLILEVTRDLGLLMSCEKLNEYVSQHMEIHKEIS